MLQALNSNSYPWCLRLDVGTLNPVELALHTRLLLYVPKHTTAADNLELLAVLGGKGEHLLLLDAVPPLPLLQTLATSFAMGVYVPSDAAVSSENKLGVTVQLKVQLDVLRKLGQLTGRVLAVCDTEGAQDPHHLTELVQAAGATQVYL